MIWLIILQKKALNGKIHILILFFFRHEIIKLPDNIAMENYLFISKFISFNLPSIFNHWFTFSPELHNYETSCSSKGLLKVKTVKTKKYGKEAMINNAILSWNNIKKIILCHVLRDLSYYKLKSLLVKHFLRYFNIDLISISVPI